MYTVKHSPLLFATLILIASGHASAAPYCVGNASEFNSMLADVDSKSPHYNDFDIRLRPGTYSSNQSLTFNPYIRATFTQQFSATYHLRLTGGWNSGCTQQAAPGGPATIIDGLGLHKILYSDVSSGPNSGNVTVETTVNQIEFRNFVSDRLPALQFTYPNGHVEISYSKFRNGTGSGLQITGDIAAQLHDNLFEGNTFSNSSSYGLALVDTTLTSSIFNNTFRGNTINTPSSGHASIIYLGAANTAGLGVTNFVNNIISGNTLCASGCYNAEVDGLVAMKNNLLDLTKVFGTPLSTLNNVNGSPQFLFNTGPEIGPTSAARDKGLSSIVSAVDFDLLGGERITSSAVDIGAYESKADAVFANGFD